MDEDSDSSDSDTEGNAQTGGTEERLSTFDQSATGAVGTNSGVGGENFRATGGANRIQK